MRAGFDGFIGIKEAWEVSTQIQIINFEFK